MDKSDVTKRIDSFLEKKTGAKEAPKSFMPLKKFMSCNWGEEPHLTGVAMESFMEMADIDDEMSKEFRKQLYAQAKTIGENVIKMYMVNNDLDMLPQRG